MHLRNEHIYLRAVEPADATMLMVWENSPENWKVSGTEIPFSLHAIELFIEQAQEFRKTGQLRLMICLNENDKTIGCVDLYEADFKNRRAGIGILIGSAEYRQKGHAKATVELVKKYAAKVFDFHQLHCLIDEDNAASLTVFESTGFERIGILKDWYFTEGKWRNVVQLQAILTTSAQVHLTNKQI